MLRGERVLQAQVKEVIWGLKFGTVMVPVLYPIFHRLDHAPPGVFVGVWLIFTAPLWWQLYRLKRDQRQGCVKVPIVVRFVSRSWRSGNMLVLARTDHGRRWLRIPLDVDRSEEVHRGRALTVTYGPHTGIVVRISHRAP